MRGKSIAFHIEKWLKLSLTFLCQVPEDIVMMLHDSTLFESSADLTTKEILKKWGEIGKVPQATVASPTTAGPRAQQARPNIPAIQRMDTDDRLWQNESSVRHVGGPNPHNTPPQNHHHHQQHHGGGGREYELGTPNLPYAHRHPTGSTESHGSPNRHSRYGSPAVQKHGALGITGAG